MSIPPYMFETLVFNRILDGAQNIGAFVGQARFSSTHIRLDEFIFATFKAELDTLSTNEPNHVQDTLIGETAIRKPI